MFVGAYIKEASVRGINTDNFEYVCNPSFQLYVQTSRSIPANERVCASFPVDSVQFEKLVDETPDLVHQQEEESDDLSDDDSTRLVR